MSKKRRETSPERTDVLIVGAGISGIGAAFYLKQQRPTTSFTIVEARDALGGTWDLFRYPGIRSDSDLYTFGYAFKPWTHDKAIASADAILSYLRETVHENDIEREIRYRHKVVAAAWSTEQARWLVEIDRGDAAGPLFISCRWLFCAAGYYSYEGGFRPQFAGESTFRGTIVHPQTWPEDLDYEGKRVVVVGSGATAVTLVPALAGKAAHVTMLQRTPSYIIPGPSEDPLAKLMYKLLPPDWAHAATRRKNIAMQRLIWRACRRYPQHARRLIRYLNARELPKDFPVDEHFNPPYDPWDQRLCLVPDGDLFKAIRSGQASVVTDRIEAFVEDGIQLASGRKLEADIIVTATGLVLKVFGGIRLTVDGAAVCPAEKVAFKGMMLSDVPNFVFAIGYTNSSWTLKVGLICEHFCRLLAHMEMHGFESCQPRLRQPDMPTRPLLDFQAGYVQRAMTQLPRQGERAPWQVVMDYQVDLTVLRDGRVADEHLEFARAKPAVSAASVPAPLTS